MKKKNKNKTKPFGFGYKPFRLFEGVDPKPTEEQILGVTQADLQEATDRTIDFCTENKIPGAIFYVFIGSSPEEVTTRASGLLTEETSPHPDLATFKDLITYQGLRGYSGFVENAIAKNRYEDIPLNQVFTVFFKLIPSSKFLVDWDLFCIHVFRYLNKYTNVAFEACSLVGEGEDGNALYNFIEAIHQTVDHSDEPCPSKGGTHKSPTEHERKAHARRIKKKDGSYKIVPVKAAIVNKGVK